MKRIIFVITILISFVGICSAEMDQECFDRCLSQNYNKTPYNQAYCEEKCGKNQVDYREQQLDIQKQQLEIQKQSLELQKQQLELQKELQEKLQQQSTSSSTAEDTGSAEK